MGAGRVNMTSTNPPYSKAEAFAEWLKANTAHPFSTPSRKPGAPLNEQGFYIWARNCKLRVGLDRYDRRKTDNEIKKLIQRRIDAANRKQEQS